MQLEVYEEEHIRRLRQGLSECCVLLKSKGDFPRAGLTQIALYGSGARRTIKGGTGSGEVNSRYYDSVEKGFENAGVRVTTGAWLDAYDRVREEAFAKFVGELRAEARQKHTNILTMCMGRTMPAPEYELPLDGEGDTALYVLSRDSGEGADRTAGSGDIALTATEIRDILALQRQYAHFMLVLNVGGVVDLGPVMAAENILILSQLGVETGDALADIVLGKTSPSGKLTTTWAGWEDYPALIDFEGYDDTRYREGIYVGYRYFDSVGSRPLFPFGYGLSYTGFALEEISVSHTGEELTVSAAVRNTGVCAGKETLQLYVSAPAGRLDKPYQSLAGFAKTPALEPGGSCRVSIRFRMSELSSYEEASASFILEKGSYLLRLGTSSRDTQVCGIVSLSEEMVVRRVRNCLGRPDFEDFRAARKETADGSGGADGVRSLAGASGSGSAGSADGARSSDGADGSDSAGSADGVRSLAGADGSGSASGAASIVVEISLSPADFVTETVRYDRQPPVDPRAAAMSDDELLHMAMGAFNPKGGVLSVVGNAGSSVAGSAGETAHVPGVRPYVMADGPAGLRIAENYFEDAKGVHSMLPPMPLSLLPFATGPLKWALKIMTPRPGRGTEVRHQYCTAIPIGTAIAQSWSTEFAELCGDIVGEEMERFGVDLWLAPALNIHRSIRCGRNFEYYSEDPLLSGKMAAGVTRGVQRHPGRAVTIKHFAANNQEFNRTSSNSLVSERAMREIYLRGFEICVKESAPRAVMSSYNLINGVHASERRDLLEDILRAEFGFRGFVMTDWVIDGGMIPKDARYRSPVCALVAAAGNDVYMPGSREDFARLTKEFGEGQVTRRQLEINATRVLCCMD